MDINRSITVDRQPAEVFDLVGSPEGYPTFFSGITRWETRSEKRSGLGARFRVLMKVGSIEAGGTLEVTEWDKPRRIAWTSVQGLRQSGAWDLLPTNNGTDLSLTISFKLSGGPAGWLVERITARIVGRNMLATLLAARRILEVGDPMGARAARERR